MHQEQNILINKDFHVWLIDYDIARIYRPEIRQDTEIHGTFGYAPIEQYGMMPTDFKTDIYAFGVTLSMLLEHSGIKGSMIIYALNNNLTVYQLDDMLYESGFATVN